MGVFNEMGVVTLFNSVSLISKKGLNLASLICCYRPTFVERLVLFSEYPLQDVPLLGTTKIQFVLSTKIVSK